MIDQLTTDFSLGPSRRGARVTQACCRLLYRPLCCRCLASEGVPQRVLMARAGERDDRDAHEGLLASISRARRSPLVSRCRATCRSCCAHRAFERQCGCSLQRHAVACVVARANGMIETFTKVFSLRSRARAARLSCRAAGRRADPAARIAHLNVNVAAACRGMLSLAWSRGRTG